MNESEIIARIEKLKCNGNVEPYVGSVTELLFELYDLYTPNALILAEIKKLEKKIDKLLGQKRTVNKRESEIINRWRETEDE